MRTRKKYNRKSKRLKAWDYSKVSLYFITLNCRSRKSIFGSIVNGEMQLNQYGRIAKEEWEKTPMIRPNISLGKYVIMPNHFHAIVHFDAQEKTKDNRIGQFKSPSHTVGAIVRGYKGATTKQIKALYRSTLKARYLSKGEASKGESGKGESGKGESQFAPTLAPSLAPTLAINLEKSIWQRDYHDIIIRDARAYNNIARYIVNNPQKWEEKNRRRKAEKGRNEKP